MSCFVQRLPRLLVAYKTCDRTLSEPQGPKFGVEMDVMVVRPTYDFTLRGLLNNPVWNTRGKVISQQIQFDTPLKRFDPDMAAKVDQISRDMRSLCCKHSRTCWDLQYCEKV